MVVATDPMELYSLNDLQSKKTNVVQAAKYALETYGFVRVETGQDLEIEPYISEFQEWTKGRFGLETLVESSRTYRKGAKLHPWIFKQDNVFKSEAWQLRSRFRIDPLGSVKDLEQFGVSAEYWYGEGTRAALEKRVLGKSQTRYEVYSWHDPLRNEDFTFLQMRENVLQGVFSIIPKSSIEQRLVHQHYQRLTVGRRRFMASHKDGRKYAILYGQTALGFFILRKDNPTLKITMPLSKSQALLFHGGGILDQGTFHGVDDLGPAPHRFSLLEG